jgi:4-hydroxythreonine-4-phosphate dehydrogenase
MLQAEAAAFLGKPVGDVPVRMMLANDELKNRVGEHSHVSQASD